MLSSKFANTCKEKSNFRLALEFGIPGLVKFYTGTDKLSHAKILHPSGSQIEMSLHEGIITEWRSSDKKKRISHEKDTPISSKIEPSFKQNKESVLNASVMTYVHKQTPKMNWEVLSTAA